MATTTMAAGADSSSNSHSPRSPNDTKIRRSNLPSPWAQVVRGVGDSMDSASYPPPPSSSPDGLPPENLQAGEVSDKGNGGNVVRKPAWNKPSSEVSVASCVSTSSDQTPTGAAAVVMGAARWPALSESTRPSLKSLSTDSPKSTPEGSIPVSQVQGPVTSHSQPPEQRSGNANHNSSTNSPAPTRQRSMKHGGGGGGGGNRQGGLSRGPPPPPRLPVFPVPEIAQSSFGNMVPVAGLDSSLRETRPMGGVATPPYSTNDHSNQRNSNRRGNFGHHGRGDGRSNYHGGRRDHDHGNHDWNFPQSPHTRDSHRHPHRPSPRGFMRPPGQGAAPFLQPLPVTPYGNALVYPDMSPVLYYLPTPPESFRVPYLTGPPAPPSYFVTPDPSFPDLIVKQIDYYFSDANLVKDEFLRSKMDDQGWVPITLIASFRLVQKLTDNIPYILECLRGSAVVEVQGDKIRRRDEWMKWIGPNRSPSDSGIQSPVGPSYDSLASSFQKASIEDVNQDGAIVQCQTLNESSGELQVTNTEAPVQGVC